MKNFCLIALLCLSSLSCAGSDILQLKPAPARSPDCGMEVFASEGDVGRRFETLCIVEACTGQGMFDERTATAAIAEAKPSLCECGADAAIILEATSQSTNNWTATVETPSHELRGNAKLKGVRYLD